MDVTKREKDMLMEEQAATIRLLTDLTEAGSWVINYAPDGSIASVQWGDGFRRLMGYTDLHDFPNEMESFLRGVHPEDRVFLPTGRPPRSLMKTSWERRDMIAAPLRRTVLYGGFAARGC